MGLISILDQEKDKIINKLESDLKTLETKNIELKYTNRNLISTITEQKNIIKELNSTITELKTSKETIISIEKLNKEHEKLLGNYKALQIKYKKSQDEISHLKASLTETKPSNGLFGRFLKKKNIETDKNIEEETKD